MPVVRHLKNAVGPGYQFGSAKEYSVSDGLMNVPGMIDNCFSELQNILWQGLFILAFA
jgi:hypothetical protein